MNNIVKANHQEMLKNIPPEMMAKIEKALIEGDLKPLNDYERLCFYYKKCASLNLNPDTGPFAYITLNGKLTLYAKKDCTEQLRSIHGISITKLETKTIDGLYVVIANAIDKNGRTDAASGVVAVDGLRGDALANAFMKAETKAKRRVTLSLAGLGLTDESEIDSIPGAKVVHLETEVIAAKEPMIGGREVLEHYVELINEQSSSDELKKIFGEGYKALKEYPELQTELKGFYDQRKLEFI